MTRTEEAKKWLREELERLRRAPDLNGCPMTQEWAEQIRVFTVALESIEAQERTPAPAISFWESYTITQYMGQDDVGDPKYREGRLYVCHNERCRRRSAVRTRFCPDCGCRMDGIT